METAPGIYGMGQSQGGYVHAFLLDDGSVLGDVEVLCVGHGEPLTSGGAARLRAALYPSSS